MAITSCKLLDWRPAWKRCFRFGATLRPAAWLALALAHGAALPTRATEFENVARSAEEGADESTDTFSADTPDIHLSADLDEIESGSKVTVSWISVDSGGAAPPDLTINEETYDVGAIDNHLNASISRPNKGWPAGTYQVQLSVDGKVAETVDFSVEQTGFSRAPP